VEFLTSSWVKLSGLPGTTWGARRPRPEAAVRAPMADHTLWLALVLPALGLIKQLSHSVSLQSLPTPGLDSNALLTRTLS
jgi:hypothetical protein